MTLGATPSFAIYDTDPIGPFLDITYCDVKYRFGFEIFENEPPGYYATVPIKDSMTYIKLSSKDFLKLLELHLKKEDVIQYVLDNLIKG